MATPRRWPAYLLAGSAALALWSAAVPLTAQQEDEGVCARIAEEVAENAALQAEITAKQEQGVSAADMTHELLQAGFPPAQVVNQVLAAVGTSEANTVREVVTAAVFETKSVGANAVRAGALCAGADPRTVEQAIRHAIANLSGVSETDGIKASPN